MNLRQAKKIIKTSGNTTIIVKAGRILRQHNVPLSLDTHARIISAATNLHIQRIYNLQLRMLQDHSKSFLGLDAITLPTHYVPSLI